MRQMKVFSWPQCFSILDSGCHLIRPSLLGRKGGVLERDFFALLLMDCMQRWTGRKRFFALILWTTTNSLDDDDERMTFHNFQRGAQEKVPRERAATQWKFGVTLAKNCCSCQTWIILVETEEKCSKMIRISPYNLKLAATSSRQWRNG